MKSVLSEQLLLLRIFFEVNKDSNADVYSIRKHEIFAQYIEKLKQNNREYLETVLDTVTDFMIHSDNYDEISITDLEKTGITSGDIRKTVNSGILLSKKLVFHEGTIARNEKEVVYFVFDEMRDYCLARQILLNNISAYNVDGESVIEKLKQLKTNVDVLTMTATPIPRTMHMSIVGIRDMSVIYEPPHNRKPVQTYVLEYDEEVIKEAITKELERDGLIIRK